MAENNQIYGKAKTELVKKAKQHLEESNISKRNQELILEWQDNLNSKGRKEERRSKLIGQAERLCKYITIDLDKATKKDIERVMAIINERKDITPGTKTDYIRLIKQFYGWFKGIDTRLEDISQLDVLELTDLNGSEKDEKIKKIKDRENQKKKAIELYDYITNELKRGKQLKDIDEKKLITPDEINLLLEKGTSNIKQKALLSLIFESGCRIGELLNIKLSDIRPENKEGYLEISVNGKTGRRTVYAYNSIRYIIQLIESNKYNDKDAYLFYNNMNSNGPIGYNMAVKLIKKVFKKANINKPCNPHNFRHSRATELVRKNMQESIQRKFMGWTADSQMLKVYVHLTKKDVENGFRQLNGLDKQEQIQDLPIICSMCRTPNSPENKYCVKCSRSLKVETVLQGQELLHQELKEAVKLYMDELMKKQSEAK